MNDEIFDERLDQSLKKLSQDKDIHKALQEFPEEATEMRPLLEIALRLQAQPVPPPSNRAKLKGEQRLREHLTSRTSRNFILLPVSAGMGFRYIGQKLASIQQNLLQVLEVLMLKKAFVSILLLGLILSTGGIFTVFASQEALPGDVLYPVKTVLEDTRLSFTFDNASWGRLSLKLAQARLEEIERLVETGNEQGVALALQRLDMHIQAIQTAALALQNDRPEESAALLQELAGLLHNRMQDLISGQYGGTPLASSVLEVLQTHLLAISQIAPSPASAPVANDNQGNSNLNQNTNTNINGNENDNTSNSNDNGGSSNDNDDDSNDNGGSSNDNDDDSNDNGGSSNDNDDDSNDNGGSSNDNDDDSNDNGGSSNDNDDDSNDNGGSSNDNDDDSNDNGGSSNDNDDDSNDNGGSSNDNDDDSNDNGGSSNDNDDDSNDNGGSSNDNDDDSNDNGGSSNDNDDDSNDNGGGSNDNDDDDND